MMSRSRRRIATAFGVHHKTRARIKHVTPDSSIVRSGNQRIGPIFGVVTVAIVAGLVSFFFFAGEQSFKEPTPGIEVTAPPTRAPSPLEEAPHEGEGIVVPLLDESDTVVRDLLASLTSHPAFATWLIPDDLIRLFVVVVENVANGDNPAEHLPPLRPTQRFRTNGESPQLGFDPVTYARYNIHAEIVTAIDPAGAAGLYHRFYPLIVEAYAELGYPDGGFNNTVLRAVRNLLETPVLERNVMLVPRPAGFEFVDNELADLLPVQKQFLGMGPRNVRAVQASLQDIIRKIGLDTTDLPVPAVIR